MEMIHVNDETLEDTLSPARSARAINAMKKMRETSVALGNDKMTLKKINTIIKNVREQNTQ